MSDAPEPFIECPTCGLKSYNKNDIAERFCGRCHAFHEDMPLVAIAELRRLNTAFYAMCFWAGVGDSAHAFIEFNGLMSKYIDLLKYGAEQGIHPRLVNEHCRTALPVAAHDMAYLGEKLRCIFGPFIDNNPEARDVLQRALFG